MGKQRRRACRRATQKKKLAAAEKKINQAKAVAEAQAKAVAEARAKAVAEAQAKQRKPQKKKATSSGLGNKPSKFKKTKKEE